MPMKSSRDPLRLLPIEPATRRLAAELYHSVADAPIISPHGHVPAQWLADDVQFTDAADLFVSHDHYVTRLLHSVGVPLGRLGVGGAASDPREAWRELCRHWHVFAGTASGYWIEDELAAVFGIEEAPSPTNADVLFDHIGALIREPGFRARALFERFGIEVLATTDDPLDPLEHHHVLAEDPSFTGRVIPTFRPDALVDPAAPGYVDRVAQLIASASTATSFAGYLDAMRHQRERFIARGAVSADHGVTEPFTCAMSAEDSERLFQLALRSELTPAQSKALQGHVLWQMAGMSVDDGLVMTVHPGVRRNHHSATYRTFGPDTGHDIPLRVEYTDNLRPLLEAFGTAAGFHLVLFAIDESVYSRELAPLAGFYPSVRIGAPWWFLDAPDAMARWRAAITETAGFYRTSGFIDDTRAYLSIPSRHDVSRRADASYLARLVVEGRVTAEVAARIIADTVDAIPRETFKL